MKRHTLPFALGLILTLVAFSCAPVDQPVEYVVFEDEGHGFLKKENRERGYEAIRAFADEHLKSIGQGMEG